MGDPQLAVFSFDSDLRAAEFLTAALRLQEEGKLRIEDAVFVHKSASGSTSVRETTDPSPGGAAISSGFWGLLFGAILGVPIAGMAVGATAGAVAAAAIDTGVPDDLVRQLREQITPGTTALALLTSTIDQDAVLAELKRFAGARLVTGTLSANAVEQVQAALADEADATSTTD
jgi:uncharacterized membrane protein